MTYVHIFERPFTINGNGIKPISDEPFILAHTPDDPDMSWREREALAKQVNGEEADSLLASLDDDDDDGILWAYERPIMPCSHRT